MQQHEHKPGESCGVCGTKEGPLFLHAKCHMESPTWVTLEGDNKLTVICATCNKPVGSFRIAA